MTYDLDAVAKAVRAVAPDAWIGNHTYFIKVSYPENEGTRFEVTDAGTFSVRHSMHPMHRSIIRAIVNELDRQDEELAGIP